MYALDLLVVLAQARQEDALQQIKLARSVKPPLVAGNGVTPCEKMLRSSLFLFFLNRFNLRLVLFIPRDGISIKS